MATAELNRYPAQANASASPPPAHRQRLIKLLAILVIFGFSTVIFLTLDWFHTAAQNRRRAAAIDNPDPCRERDPIRHHAFKPNCASVNYWGTEKYKLFTNSLGFRDERIREVPLRDGRPRILILGNSYTEGKVAWPKTFPGRIADALPQYDFLNGGVDGYSPSNFLNTTRAVLAKDVEIDEVIVFLDNSAVQLEAAFYRDAGSDGAVTAIPPDEQHSAATGYSKLRKWLGMHFGISWQVLHPLDRVQKVLVRHGFYHLPGDFFGDPFDMEVSGWSYRKVNETEPFAAGYAPLGVEGGNARAQAKMTALWQELSRRNIPLSVVVYPHLAQVVHDTADSPEVQMWREWCQGRCKRFVSVFPAFYAARDACPPSERGCWYQTLFVYGDIHYNAGGNALVADELVRSLQQQPPKKGTSNSNRPPQAPLKTRPDTSLSHDSIND
jgi:hypothetical protein